VPEDGEKDTPWWASTDPAIALRFNQVIQLIRDHLGCDRAEA
jgi:hypothetical protein